MRINQSICYAARALTAHENITEGALFMIIQPILAFINEALTTLLTAVGSL